MSDRGEQALAFFDRWEKRDYDGCMGFFAGGAVIADRPRGTELRDPGDIRAWLESWVTACPDATASATVPVASHDAATVQGVYRGTNDGPLGPLPATGKSVAMPFAIVLRFDGDARITTYDVFYDQVTLLTQLGHMPS